MGELSGKVAFITGAARGQGRAHAVKLSSMGADIIAVDLCDQIASVPYPMATPDDLAATVKLVEENDARIVAAQADVRDRNAVKAALKAGVEEFGGRLDIVIANAGIAPMAGEDAWQDVIDVNLTGVYNTIEVAMRPMVRRRVQSLVQSLVQGLVQGLGLGGHGVGDVLRLPAARLDRRLRCRRRLVRGGLDRVVVQRRAAQRPRHGRGGLVGGGPACGQTPGSTGGRLIPRIGRVVVVAIGKVIREIVLGEARRCVVLVAVLAVQAAGDHIAQRVRQFPDRRAGDQQQAEQHAHDEQRRGDPDGQPVRERPADDEADETGGAAALPRLGGPTGPDVPQAEHRQCDHGGAEDQPWPRVGVRVGAHQRDGQRHQQDRQHHDRGSDDRAHAVVDPRTDGSGRVEPGAGRDQEGDAEQRQRDAVTTVSGLEFARTADTAGGGSGPLGEHQPAGAGTTTDRSTGGSHRRWVGRWFAGRLASG